MGIRFFCPNGHKLNIKAHLAGKRGFCPVCGTKMRIPLASTRPAGRRKRKVEVGAVPPSEDLPAQRVVPDAEEEIEAWLEEEEEGSPTPKASPSASPASRPVAAKDKTPATPSPAFEELDLTALAALGFPETPPPPRPARQTGFDKTDLWYVRPPSGGQFGPASSQVIGSWIREGRVPSDSLVWREGWRDWLTAAEAFPQMGFDYGPSRETATAEPAKPPIAPKPRGNKTLRGPRSRFNQSTVLIALLGTATLIVFIVLLVLLIRRAEESPTTAPPRPPLRSALSLDSPGPGPARPLL